MNIRAIGFLAPLILVCHAAGCFGAATASGRNWQVAIDSSACDAAASQIAIGARIRYLGPGGVVEAPVSRLVDGSGKAYLPKSLVWKGGNRQFAVLLAAGGLRQLQSADSSEVQFKFDVRDPDGDLQFEFGDVKALPLTRTRSSGKGGMCGNLLKPGQMPSVPRPRLAGVEGAKTGLRVFREAYPCLAPARGTRRTIEAPYPPYLPRQLLVFGRGYLPNARQIELPMGRAAAQSYSYAGLDELKAMDAATRRAILADFPEYASESKHFAFDWGVQKAASGNELYSVGIYAVRPCTS